MREKLMIFDSGYRKYFSIGTNLDLMAKSILERYNSFTEKEYSLQDMANDEENNFYVYSNLKLDGAFDCEYLYGSMFTEKTTISDYLDSFR